MNKDLKDLKYIISLVVILVLILVFRYYAGKKDLQLVGLNKVLLYASLISVLLGIAYFTHKYVNKIRYGVKEL